MMDLFENENFHPHPKYNFLSITFSYSNIKFVVSLHLISGSRTNIDVLLLLCMTNINKSSLFFYLSSDVCDLFHFIKVTRFKISKPVKLNM